MEEGAEGVRFNKIRVPWNQVYDVWCGLSEANNDWWDLGEEKVEGHERWEEDEEVGDGWLWLGRGNSGMAWEVGGV